MFAELKDRAARRGECEGDGVGVREQVKCGVRGKESRQGVQVRVHIAHVAELQLINHLENCQQEREVQTYRAH